MAFTYLVTDKGPQHAELQHQWLMEIGKTEDPSCMCDGWTLQNAAHLYQCPWVGDGRGDPGSWQAETRGGGAFRAVMGWVCT